MNSLPIQKRWILSAGENLQELVFFKHILLSPIGLERGDFLFPDGRSGVKHSVLGSRS